MLDLEDELNILSLRGPGRPPKVLRQPLAPTSEPMKTSDSWWMKAGRSGFTERAEQERARMSCDLEGRKVPDSINGAWIKGVGVVGS
jgi:hypothetical protein